MNKLEIALERSDHARYQGHSRTCRFIFDHFFRQYIGFKWHVMHRIPGPITNADAIAMIQEIVLNRFVSDQPGSFMKEYWHAQTTIHPDCDLLGLRQKDMQRNQTIPFENFPAHLKNVVAFQPLRPNRVVGMKEGRQSNNLRGDESVPGESALNQQEYKDQRCGRHYRIHQPGPC